MNTRSNRRKPLFLFIGALIFSGWAVPHANAAPASKDPKQLSTEWPSVGKFEPQGERVYHGASLPEFWSAKMLPRHVKEFAKTTGKDLAVITWFANVSNNKRMTTWATEYKPILLRVRRQKALSLIKFSTIDSNFGQTQKAASPKQIAQGVWDAYFEEFADTIKEFGSPVFISIDHEMNGSWYPYSQAYPNSQSTAADYVAMWRRIVDVFRQRGATNVAWVWSPSVVDIGGVPAAQYYPGDDYVNWIGVSFYSSSTPTELDSLYRVYAQRKPFFVTEWATNSEKSRYNPKYPGDAQWIDQFFNALETRYKRVKAISWFEWNAADGNYTLGRDGKQLAAYKKHIKNPRYVGKSEYLYKPGATQ